MSRCSYCNQYGHNIRSCNHPTINLAIQQMRIKYEYCYLNTPRGSIILRLRFISYLHQYFNLPVIRAVVCRLQIGNASMSKRTSIEYIANYFDYQYNASGIENWYIDRSPGPIFASVDTRESTHSSTNTTYELADITWFTARQDVNYTDINYNIQPSTIQMKVVDNVDETLENFDCPICLDCVEKKDSVKFNCAHEICCTCMGEMIKTNNQDILCALCRVKVTHLDVCSTNSCEKLKTYTQRIQVC